MHYVVLELSTQTRLASEFTEIFLPLPSERWNYRNVLPHPALPTCFCYYLWLVLWRTNWGRAIPYSERAYRYWGFNSMEELGSNPENSRGNRELSKHKYIRHGMTGIWNQEEMYKVLPFLWENMHSSLFKQCSHSQCTAWEEQMNILRKWHPMPTASISTPWRSSSSQVLWSCFIPRRPKGTQPPLFNDTSSISRQECWLKL